MKKELENLKKLYGTKKFEHELEKFYKKYNDDPDVKREISKFIKDGLAASAKRIAALEKEVNVKTPVKRQVH